MGSVYKYEHRTLCVRFRSTCVNVAVGIAALEMAAAAAARCIKSYDLLRHMN
jgi:hypothetical protein